VIGQLAVAPEANEITAALHLLKTLPLQVPKALNGRSKTA